MKGPIQKLLIFLTWSIGLIVFSSCSKKFAEISPTSGRGVLESQTDSSGLVSPPIVIAKSLSFDTLIYSNRNLIVDSYYSQRVQEKTNQFYQSNAFRTQWLFDHTPGSLYYVMLEYLKNAIHFGLVPDDYDVTGIEESVKRVYAYEPPATSEIVSLDIHITKMYFLFTTHLQEGKVRVVGNAGRVWKRSAHKYPSIDVSMLLEIRDKNQFQESLSKLQPADEQYVKLQRALDYYRFLENTSPTAFPTFVVSGGIKPGESNELIPSIRSKLSVMTQMVLPVLFDSLAGFADSLRYDDALLSAVTTFQVGHGLAPDGIIGDRTVKYLNQSFAEKADVIALNMERMRWLPKGYGENCIVVNIPEYKLRVYENRSVALEMKVIVGAADKATPVFSDVMEYIVFSPTWTVPVSIIKEEIIPQLKENPQHYSKKNYSFFKDNVEIDPDSISWNTDVINPYQLRIVQDPGPQNSLGLVKFVMPNNMNVYLHDTPNHRLFSKDYRALSHGCVRLDEPARFAAYLLRDQNGWSEERISKAMHSEKPGTVLLKKHYEIHLEYRTAWVDEAGRVNFREDIYGHDRMQLMQLMPVVKPALVLYGKL